MFTPSRSFLVLSCLAGLLTTACGWAAVAENRHDHDHWNLTRLGEWTEGPSNAVTVAGALVLYGSGCHLVVGTLTPNAVVEEIGRLPLGGVVIDVAVVDNLAYVAARGGGLRVVDLSDPTHPVEIGFFHADDDVRGVTPVGDLVYVAADMAGLYILDVTDPAQPALLGHLDLPGTTRAVAVRDGHAFLACDIGGFFRVADVSDPAHPFEVTYIFGGGGWPADLVLYGDHALVAGRIGGFYVIDISDPAHPFEVANIDILGNGGQPEAVHLVGNLALLASGYDGLGVVDVTDPTEPILRGEVECPGHMLGLANLGTTVLTACRRAGVRSYDLAGDPLPVYLNTTVTAGNVRDLAVAGGFVHLGDWFAGLRCLDIADPASPAAVGIFGGTGDGLVEDVAPVRPGLVAISARFEGVYLVDVSDPAAPVLAGFFPLDDVAGNSFAVGDLLYVVEWSQGLFILDVSDPASPILVGQTETAPGATDVEVAGGYACVGNGENGIVVVDVHDPAAPYPVGSGNTPGYVHDVALNWPGVYVADGSLEDLLVFDLSDPTDPVHVATWQPPEGRGVFAVDLLGERVAAACGSEGVYLLEGFEPFLVEVGYYNTPGSATGVEIFGNLVGVADNDAGFLLLEDEGVVPALLTRFTAEPGVGEVQLAWQTSRTCSPESFVLEARSGSDRWNVGPVAGIRDRFSAADRAPVLQRGGRVSYGLSWLGPDGPVSLAEKTVHLVAPDARPRLTALFPNPSNAGTTVGFSLARAQTVRVTVHDLAGRKVTCLAEGPHPPGVHFLTWDGRTAAGTLAGSGLYLVRLESEDGLDIRRFSLVK